MKIWEIRSIFYKVAKYLGDLTAVEKSVDQKSFLPLIKRIKNRIIGKFTGRFFR